MDNPIKLTKRQELAFGLIGSAIVSAKHAARAKRDALADVKVVLDENRDLFAAGVTIGNYRFQTVTRTELQAIEL